MDGEALIRADWPSRLGEAARRGASVELPCADGTAWSWPAYPDGARSPISPAHAISPITNSTKVRMAPLLSWVLKRQLLGHSLFTRANSEPKREGGPGAY